MINVNMSSNLQGVQGWQQLGELVKAGGRSVSTPTSARPCLLA